jgi:hypothetical protein
MPVAGHRQNDAALGAPEAKRLKDVQAHTGLGTAAEAADIYNDPTGSSGRSFFDLDLSIFPTH